MKIAEALHPLLGSFTLEIPPQNWWLVVEEYLQQGEVDGRLLAEAIDAVAMAEESDQELSDALVGIGCYYWPGSSISLREWLQTLAQRLRSQASHA